MLTRNTLLKTYFPHRSCSPGLPVLGAVLFNYLLAGCASESEAPPIPAVMHDHDDHGHDHEDHSHDHPETFAEAVSQLTAMRNTIRDGFANNDEDAAHEPLHDVGHLLEDLEGLAEKESLTDEQKAALKSSVETLFNAFGDVDKTLHGGEGATYSEVSEKIDAALKTISDMVKPGDAHHDDDHDHADHDHADHDHADHKDGDHKDADHKDADHKEETAAEGDSAKKE
ncbi:MAG: hypothetical protein KDA89_22800 [Planctomycetaceae bacterium]|nr:hypothetical protein [Planctomycetaceae bacterium]